MRSENRLMKRCSQKRENCVPSIAENLVCQSGIRQDETEQLVAGLAEDVAFQQQPFIFSMEYFFSVYAIFGGA